MVSISALAMADNNESTGAVKLRLITVLPQINAPILASNPALLVGNNKPTFFSGLCLLKRRENSRLIINALRRDNETLLLISVKQVVRPLCLARSTHECAKLGNSSVWLRHVSMDRSNTALLTAYAWVSTAIAGPKATMTSRRIRLWRSNCILLLERENRLPHKPCK